MKKALANAKAQFVAQPIETTVVLLSAASLAAVSINSVAKMIEATAYAYRASKMK